MLTLRNSNELCNNNIEYQTSNSSTLCLSSVQKNNTQEWGITQQISRQKFHVRLTTGIGMVTWGSETILDTQNSSHWKTKLSKSKWSAILNHFLRTNSFIWLACCNVHYKIWHTFQNYRKSLYYFYMAFLFDYAVI